MAAKKLHTGLIAFMLVAALGPLEAQDTTVETQLVDAMSKLYSVHPGFRANHAKGVVVTGSFKATPQAARLSKAVLFAGATIPVTVRFSDATGIPDILDGSDLANPHGMAIKFHLPDGSETDMVLNSKSARRTFPAGGIGQDRVDYCRWVGREEAGRRERAKNPRKSCVTAEISVEISPVT
jgi:catalase